VEYQRLGDYIREVNVRNSELKVKKPMGINIDKYFMPSVANVIGTDLSLYKLVFKNQFACNLMHVGRDERIPMAMLNGNDPIIVSPAYYVFEITKTKELLPEYLMMWFRRPEFDRNAWFYTDSDVRGGMDKDALLDMRLPIPSIARQREIVEEYETLSSRIRLNEQMIARLEETAQALYRKMFVDGIDKENLPEGWRRGRLGEVCEINTDNISSKDKYKEIDYLDSSSVTENRFDAYQHLIVGKDEIPSRAKRKVKCNDILYSTVRPNLKHYGIIKGDVGSVVVSTAFAVIRSNTPEISNELLYLILTDDAITEILQGIAEMSKATYPSITPENIMELKVTLPIQMDSKLNWSLKQIFDNIAIIHKENKKLTELQSLLLARMGK
jgi:type I restriction enzyme S subunit